MILYEASFYIFCCKRGGSYIQFYAQLPQNIDNNATILYNYIIVS